VYAKLKGADSIFTLASEPAKKFAVQINDLRDLRVLAFAPASVQSIAIVRGADKLALHRAAAGWQLTAPVSVVADETAVNRFLEELAGVRAQRFVVDVTTEPQRYGLATPAATVTLIGAGTNVLLVGSLDDSNTLRYAKCASEEFIYGVATNLLDQLPANYGALRSRSVFDWKPEQITQLVAGEVTVTRAAGKWKLVTPPAGLLNTNAVQAIVAAVAKLQVESFGRPKAEPDAGLGYTITATVDNATHWLAVAPDGQAAASSVELTFQLPPATVATLTNSVLAAKP